MIDCGILKEWRVRASLNEESHRSMSFPMFGDPRFMQSAFTLAFQRVPLIRRRANELEDYLRERYLHPQVIAIPDELDASLPRMLFRSMHGHSHIAVTQVSFVLTVVFSPDYQADRSLVRSYLTERVPLLFELLDAVESPRPWFCGLTTTVQLQSEQRDEEITTYLANRLLRSPRRPDLYEIHVRIAAVDEDRFFSNTLVGNYRSFDVRGSDPAEAAAGAVRLPRGAATGRGLQLLIDVNDRYAFNERSDYRTDPDAGRSVISKTFEAVEAAIGDLEGAP